MTKFAEKVPSASSGDEPLRRRTFRQHLLNSPERLPRAFFVFDQREADVRVAVVAEADAGAYGYLRLRQKALGKLQGAEASILLGDLGPDEHRGLGHGDLPA